MTEIIKGLKLTIEGREYDLDLSKYMFDEAMALEEQWGVTTLELSNAVVSGNPPLRIVGALVWLAQVRAAAAEHSMSFAAAAEAMPVTGFNFNLAAIALETVAEPENPTGAGTRTPATRTTRATSGKPRTKRATTRSSADAT